MSSYFYYIVIIVSGAGGENRNEGIDKIIISKQNKNNTQVLESDYIRQAGEKKIIENIYYLQSDTGDQNQKQKQKK